MLLPFPEKGRAARRSNGPPQRLLHVDRFLFPGCPPAAATASQVSSLFLTPFPSIPSIAVPNSTSPPLVSPVNPLNDDQRRAAAALLRLQQVSPVAAELGRRFAKHGYELAL